jgi:hypothetical protein
MRNRHRTIRPPGPSEPEDAFPLSLSPETSPGNDLRNGTGLANTVAVVTTVFIEATMNARVFAGSLLTGLVITAPASAQQVGYSTYHRPPVVAYHRPQARRVVVVERYAPRVLVVERIRAHRHAGYWARHGYRPVTLCYENGRYYDACDDDECR